MVGVMDAIAPNQSRLNEDPTGLTGSGRKRY